jgi:hypothetical protein
VLAPSSIKIVFRYFSPIVEILQEVSGNEKRVRIAEVIDLRDRLSIGLHQHCDGSASFPFQITILSRPKLSQNLCAQCVHDGTRFLDQSPLFRANSQKWILRDGRQLQRRQKSLLRRVTRYFRTLLRASKTG